mgnify:CR=1 FL=1
MTKRERTLLIELMKREITPENFRKRFTVDVVKRPDFIRVLLEKTLEQKQANDVEYLLTAIFYFKLFLEEYVDVLCKLMNEHWHVSHENIASIFQKTKSPKTIDCLYKAALTQFKYLKFDEAFALAVKCIWALGDINTSESREKLKLLSKSGNEIIKNNAIQQLGRVQK